MVRENWRFGRNVFWGILLFAILVNSTAFSEDVETALTDANALFKSKKFEQAKTLYQSLSKDSDSSVAINALIGVGRCEIKLGNTAAAEQLIGIIKSGYSQHPDFCKSLGGLSYDYLDKGKFAESKSLCQYILQQSPADDLAIVLQRRIARCQIRQENFTESDQTVQKIMSDYPQNDNLCKELNIIAFEYRWKGDVGRSKNLWEYVAENTSNSSLAMRLRSNIAQCEFIAGDYDKADQLVEAFKADYPGKKALFGLVNDIAGRCYKKQLFEAAAKHYQYIADNNPNVSEAFKAQMRVVDSRVELFDTASTDEAVNKLLNVFAEVPGHCNEIYSLANTYYKSGKYSNAEALYQFVAGNDNAGDLAVKAATDIVGCNIAAGNFDKADAALDTLNTAQSDNPKLYDSLFSLGEKLVKLDKRDRAMGLYQYIADNTLDADMKIGAQCELVRCTISAGDEAAIDSAIEKFKSDYSGHQLRSDRLNNIANGLREAGRYDKASEVFMYISDNTSDSAEAQKTGMRAVISLIKGKDNAGAEELFDQYCSKYYSSEDFVGKLVSICKVFEGSEDPAMALPYINKTLEVATDLNIAVRMLRLKAMCYMDMGAEDQVKAVQDEIAQYSEQQYYPGVQLVIADKYRKNGQYQKAIETYDKVINNTADKTQRLYAHAGIGMSNVWLGNDPCVISSVNTLCEDFAGHEKLGWGVYVIGEEYYTLGIQLSGKIRSYNINDEYYHQVSDNFDKARTVWQRNMYEIPDKKYKGMAYYSVGHSYRRLHDYKNAIEYFEMLLNKAPRYEKAWDAQHQITLALNRMYINDEMTLEEVKPLILESCEKFKKNFPNSMISGAEQKYVEKYNNL